MTRRIVIILALVVTSIAVWAGTRSNSPQLENTGAALVEVVIPEMSQPLREGKANYDQFCAACHGANAAGQEAVAPPFVHRIYEPSHHGDGAFFAAAANGVQAHHWSFGNMPPVEGINRSQLESVVSYIRAVQRANGIN